MTELRLLSVSFTRIVGRTALDLDGGEREKMAPVGEAMANPYCEVLHIDPPVLERVRTHREANAFTLLIVALLERGGSMTLEEVAARFDEAGVAPAVFAIRSLKRCKPARPPIYRDDDLYSLDPHDFRLGLWLFRLGLRPALVPRLEVVRPEPDPLPGPEVPLRVDELDTVWTDATLNGWSARRLALAVLDAHAEPMAPGEVVDFVTQRTPWHILKVDSPQLGRRGCPVQIRPDGRWCIAPDADESLRAMRRAVREQVSLARRRATQGFDPAVMAANRKAVERKRAANAAELAKLRRVLLYAFPAKQPEAVALLDVEERALETFVGAELPSLTQRLTEFDIIGALSVRPLLAALGFDPGHRRLADLGPPQKSTKLNRRGRTLKITTELLIRGSCGITRPFGDEDELATYLRDSQIAKLKSRLEASVKSLYALYQYGRLHGSVRLRWRSLDDHIPAPWAYRDEPKLHDLKQTAADQNLPLEVVVGPAPGWADPWARRQLATVHRNQYGWASLLVDEDGFAIPTDDVQLARLVTTGVHTP